MIPTPNYADRRHGLKLHRRRERREERADLRRLRRHGSMLAGRRRRPEEWPRIKFDGQSYVFEAAYGHPWTCSHKTAVGL